MASTALDASTGIRVANPLGSSSSDGKQQAEKRTAPIMKEQVSLHGDVSNLTCRRYAEQPDRSLGFKVRGVDEFGACTAGLP
jgi:hypothetical protein